MSDISSQNAILLGHSPAQNLEENTKLYKQWWDNEMVTFSLESNLTLSHTLLPSISILGCIPKRNSCTGHRRDT